jgi:hypothetical protein
MDADELSAGLWKNWGIGNTLATPPQEISPSCGENGNAVESVTNGIIRT